MQSTSPIPPNRQTITALFRCRAHWKTSHTSHTMKGTHHSHDSRARRLKRKNRRHHGLSAECTGPGKIETTDSRKPVIGGIAEHTLARACHLAATAEAAMSAERSIS